jgi:hypothetical protein
MGLVFSFPCASLSQHAEDQRDYESAERCDQEHDLGEAQGSGV